MALITDLYSDLKYSKWRIQYGGQVNLNNFYKQWLSYCLRHFGFFIHFQRAKYHQKRPAAILIEKPMQGCVIRQKNGNIIQAI